jgi:hypothetical protein
METVMSNQAVAIPSPKSVYGGKSMESHSKVSLEVNKTQVLMKLSTKREVPDGVTSKLKYILGKGLS